MSGVASGSIGVLGRTPLFWLMSSRVRRRRARLLCNRRPARTTGVFRRGCRVWRQVQPASLGGRHFFGRCHSGHAYGVPGYCGIVVLIGRPGHEVRDRCGSVHRRVWPSSCSDDRGMRSGIDAVAYTVVCGPRRDRRTEVCRRGYRVWRQVQPASFADDRLNVEVVEDFCVDLDCLAYFVQVYEFVGSVGTG